MTLLGGTTMARKEQKTPVMWQKQLCKPWHCTRALTQLRGIFQLHISWFQGTRVSLPCCLLMNVLVPERGTQGAAATNVPGPAPGQSSDLHSPDGWTEPQQVTVWAITAQPSVPRESCRVFPFLPQLSSFPFLILESFVSIFGNSCSIEKSMPLLPLGNDVLQLRGCHPFSARL